MALPPGLRPSRETRLLLIIIVVSATALVLLARLRFPDSAPSDRPPIVANPLDRLAARAAFDDLARSFGQARAQIERAFSVVRIEVEPGDVEPHPPVQYAPALRIRDSVAVVPWSAGFGRPVVTLGSTRVPVSAVASDPTRGFAVMEVPAEPAPTLSLHTAPTSALVPRYVAAVEAGPAGLVVRPMFLSAARPVPDTSWGRALEQIDGSPPSDGAFLFSIEGQLLGLLLRSDRRVLLVPAPAVFAEAEQLLERGSLVPGDFAVELQELSAPVGGAAGVDRGVVVSHVLPDGPSAEVLEAGDIIVSVNGISTPTIDEFRLQEVRSAPGSEASVILARGGDRVVVDIVPRPRLASSSAPTSESSGELGLNTRTIRGRGAEVLQVRVDGLAAASGVAAGDVVTRFGSASKPTSADITRAWKDLASGASVIVAVSRDGSHFVTAIRKP